MEHRPSLKRKTGRTGNAGILARIFLTFLRHAPLFLAAILATALYTATMTGRAALVLPFTRMLAEKEEGGGIERTLVKGVSGTLKEVNEVLDRLDGKLYHAVEPILPSSVKQDERTRAMAGTLLTCIFGLLSISLLAAVSHFSHFYIREMLVVRVLVTLRIRLLQNLLHQPLAFYNDQQRGELISRLSNDVHASTACLRLMVGDLLRQPFMILWPIIVIVAMKWWLAFFLGGYLAIFAFQLRKQTRRVHRRAKKRQRTIAKVTEAMVQMFSGIRVVKAFGLEKEKVHEYARRNDQFARDAMATEAAKAWTRTKMEFLTHILIALALVLALFLLTGGGGMAPAELALFVVLLAQIHRPTKLLTNGVTGLLDHLAGARRMYEFMDLQPGLTDKKDAIPLQDVVGGVRFEDVSFAYNGNSKVLEHINLEVPAGQVVALVGHSGAGKSTLVNLVPRFYDPVSGRITIDGTDIREFTRESLLQNIAIVTQEPFLFNTTIRENIGYGKPGASFEEIVAAAEAANIHDFIAGLPRGYETIVGERGANLSGGQCQRITIARAILRDAKILILDEATSSLDSESERAVQAALQNLMKGRTTLVIAHRLSTVQHADKIVVLQDGRIAEMGTHDALMAGDTLYRRLYDMQFASA